jgi:uncharacterized RDD family membrane protein YckC
MDNKNKLAFKKQNYIIMLIGVAFLIVGFFVMSLDKTMHGTGFLGLTLGPIIIILGFIIEFVAIMYNPKSE